MLTNRIYEPRSFVRGVFSFLAVLSLLGLGFASALAQQPVDAGVDFLEMGPDLTIEIDLLELGLCPGCFILGDPVVEFRPEPIDPDPIDPNPFGPTSLGSTDTIVQRLSDTPPLNPGESAIVPIEMIALSLVSIEPILIECDGVQYPAEVKVKVMPGDPQPTGTINIRKTQLNGGRFSWQMQVRPLIEFVRVDECPAVPICSVRGDLLLTVADAPWAHQATLPQVLHIPGLSSNFVPGADPGGAPGGHPGFDIVSPELSWRVRPTSKPKMTQVAWQEAVHFEFLLENTGGTTGSRVDALRLFEPRFVPLRPLGPPDDEIYIKSNGICNLDALWTTPPSSWCRVNWDPQSPNFRDEAWWFFESVNPGEVAPAMDIVFSVPDSATYCTTGGIFWYEIDYECYFQCGVLDRGTIRFRCDIGSETPANAPPPPPIRVRIGSILEQNSPNPFSPSTTIRYSLAQSEKVTLRVYDVNGGLVRTLFEGREDAGIQTKIWDGKDATGTRVAAGSYFYEIQVGTQRDARKMILLN